MKQCTKTKQTQGREKQSEQTCCLCKNSTRQGTSSQKEVAKSGRTICNEITDWTKRLFGARYAQGVTKRKTHSGGEQNQSQTRQKSNDKQHNTTGYAECKTQIKLQLKRERTIESLPKICPRPPTFEKREPKPSLLEREQCSLENQASKSKHCLLLCQPQMRTLWWAILLFRSEWAQNRSENFERLRKNSERKSLRARKYNKNILLLVCNFANTQSVQQVIILQKPKTKDKLLWQTYYLWKICRKRASAFRGEAQQTAKT